jgi:hypothetical protein
MRKAAEEIQVLRALKKLSKRKGRPAIGDLFFKGE